MNAWTGSFQLGRATKICGATHQPLAPGSSYVASLVEDQESGQTIRMDFSTGACIEGKLPPIPAHRLIAYWRATLNESAAKPQQFMDDEGMLDLFQSTGTLDNGSESQPSTQEDGKASAPVSRAHVRYVLALLLIRRRLLVQDSHRAGSIFVRVKGVPKPPEGPPLIEVKDPGIDETTIADVLTELEGLGISSGEPNSSLTNAAKTT
jgi:hypothetical protein